MSESNKSKESTTPAIGSPEHIKAVNEALALSVQADTKLAELGGIAIKKRFIFDPRVKAKLTVKEGTEPVPAAVNESLFETGITQMDCIASALSGSPIISPPSNPSKLQLIIVQHPKPAAMVGSADRYTVTVEASSTRLPQQ